MILVWILTAALQVLEWFLSLFTFLPVLTLPSGFSVTVAVPFVGAGGVSMMNVWLPIAILVVGALVLGRALQWLYQLIPGKFT